MVSVSISPSNSINRSGSFDVDYRYNPTVLYKLIESKQWHDVVTRVKEHPEEAAGFVTRYRKDGSLRWKLLPLHAVLCLKAPKEVTLSVFRAFQEAASLSDDQGMLPVHLAMKNENIEDEVIRALLLAYPAAVNTKDSKGRLPIEMKGKPSLSILQMALEVQRKKIRAQERTLVESKLSAERESANKEISRLEREISYLRSEASSETDLKQRKTIATQTNKLEHRDSLLQNAQAKIISQQELIAKLSNASADFDSAMKTINELQSKLDQSDRENAELKFRLGQQDSHIRSLNLSEESKSIEAGKLNDSLLVLKAQLDAQEVELKRKKHECKVLTEHERGLLSDLEKLRETCKTREAQVDILEEKFKGVSKINDEYSSSLERMTFQVNRIVDTFRELASDHDETVQALLQYEEMLEGYNTKKETGLVRIMEDEKSMINSEADGRKRIMDLILRHKKKLHLMNSTLNKGMSMKESGRSDHGQSNEYTDIPPRPELQSHSRNS